MILDNTPDASRVAMDRSQPAVAWVVVLGDLGRSPRMQYHTLSLSQQAGMRVCVLADCQSKPISGLLQAQNIHLLPLPRLPLWVSKLPSLLRLLVKACLQLLLLAWHLLASRPRPDLVLLQVPPAVPIMAVCWAACRWHGAQWLVDWHNFGFTLMGISMGSRHWLVRVAHAFERFWGRRADASLCVSRAMQQELSANWRIAAEVFHDRAPAMFRPASLQEQHELLQRLQPALAEAMHPHDCSATACTELTAGGLRRRAGRPAVVVSSTSWTPDEDFGILLRAAQLYDAQAAQDPSLPRLLVLVTGKGPLKQRYRQQMQGLDLRRVAFRTMWLEPGDYPLLLGSADLGVSLHTSSSGLDLPMKVVDMYGSGLPVCAKRYSCIGELVCEGRTGLLFDHPAELAQQWRSLFASFPVCEHLKQMQGAISVDHAQRWHDAWAETVLPLTRLLVAAKPAKQSRGRTKQLRDHTA